MLLYKYLPPERIDVLRGGAIRFTQPGAFDDPFEFLPDLTFGEDDRDGIRQLAPPGATQADVANAILRGVSRKEAGAAVLFRGLNELVGVLSLTSTPSSLPMWAYYAGGHRGFVIEIDTDHERFREINGRSALRQVVYSEARPRFVMLPENSGQDEALSLAVMTTKSAQWQHEGEVRIVANLSQGTKVPGKKDDHGYPIVLFQLPGECVRRVIMGFRMAEPNRREIRALLREDRYSHVRLEHAVLHNTRFELEFQQRRP